ncbi:MAG: sigma factor-like helix-turn-helix DNA-binding protein, partial [bacterium]
MDHARAERFGELIVPHLTALYCTALRLAGKAEDAEDLVQETCLRAFRALDQLREPAAAKVWVFTVLRAVVRLPLVHREPILLAHVAGFSYREMAEILEVPVGTVMSRLFRARRLLRQMLAET